VNSSDGFLVYDLDVGKCRIRVIHALSACAKGNLVAVATLADSRISLLSPLVASAVLCERSGASRPRRMRSGNAS
jgi:hypothetical protein